MRIVLDTNVFISGVFFGSAPGMILQAWRSGEVSLVVSKPILEEYERVGFRTLEEVPQLGPLPLASSGGYSRRGGPASPCAEARMLGPGRLWWDRGVKTTCLRRKVPLARGAVIAEAN